MVVLCLYHYVCKVSSAITRQPFLKFRFFLSRETRALAAAIILLWLTFVFW